MMVEKEYCNPNKFNPRLKIPKSGNAFYNRKATGRGYSNAIQGKNTDGKPYPGLEVLSNCVGWCTSRFAEILNDTSFNYLKPVNAENFIQYADKSLEIGQTPRIGAVMVWQKGTTLRGSDGAGHVAMVEIVKSSTEVITSESGYGYKPFWNQTRKKGKDGNWGQSSAYKFLGFIYNPAPCCQNNITTNTSTNISTTSSNTSIVNKNQTVQTAKLKDLKLKGTYIVTADDGLNLRLGAGIDYESILLMSKDTKVSNYGFYNAVGDIKWLYVQCVINGKKYLGYCSIKYLKKQ